MFRWSDEHYLGTMVIEPEMVVIRSGEFLMGCDTGAEDEKPIHQVYVDQFAIGRFAVTNRLYSFFIDATKFQAPQTWNDPQFNHPEQPVTSVSWFDAAGSAHGSRMKPEKLIVFPLKPNGNEQREVD